MAAMTRKQFDDAVQAAKEAATAYYDTGTVLMADVDFDTLIDQISEAATANPGWDTLGVLDQVAAGASAGGTVTHTSLMGSLEKARDFDAVDKFASSIQGALVIEPKLDGLAIRAEYSGGKLQLVATRGDGTTGDNVTGQARTISGLPDTIPDLRDIELRGEVYMTDADFTVSNENRMASGKPGFANPRNAVAGSLRSADRDYAVAMSFAAYDAYPEGSIEPGYLGTMRAIERWGVRTAAGLTGFTETESAEGAQAAIEALGERRSTLGYPIDGAVVKADSYADRTALGMKTRSPSWAVAYKYAPNEATTTLLDIEVAIGRTGRISLRAVLAPVRVGGSTVTYATLHSPAFIEQQGLAIGQTVLILLAGDVIPRCTAQVGSQPGSTPAWRPPAGCPNCGETWNKESLLWRCMTPACSTVGRITYAVSRDCLDIMGVSEAIATALVESGLVSSIADLYDLTETQLAALELGTTPAGNPRLVGPTVAAKIKAEIDKSREQPLSRVITALGIRKTGRTMGRRLAAAFQTMDKLRAATEAQLAAVDGIGVEKARVIAAELATIGHLIDRLAAAGVTMASVPAVASSGPAAGTEPAVALPLDGQTVVVTGAMTGDLAGLSRNEMNELIEQNGGKSSGSVSKNTTLVVAADETTSKAVKARELKITVVSPDEFAKRLGRGRG